MTSVHHLVPRLRMSGPAPLLPLYALIAYTTRSVLRTLPVRVSFSVLCSSALNSVTVGARCEGLTECGL
jgi:hypothetical protein